MFKFESSVGAVGAREAFSDHLARKYLAPVGVGGDTLARMTDNVKIAFAAAGTTHTQAWSLAVENANYSLGKILEDGPKKAAEISQATAIMMFSKYKTHDILRLVPDFFAKAPLEAVCNSLLLDRGNSALVQAGRRHAQNAPEQFEKTLAMLRWKAWKSEEPTGDPNSRIATFSADVAAWSLSAETLALPEDMGLGAGHRPDLSRL